VLANFTPEVWHDYRVGVPTGGRWTTLACSDAAEFGGSGQVPGDVHADSTPIQGMPHSIVLSVPPMSVTFMQEEK
jgi:1,4-alpha-glucan branching enzyme